MVMFVIIENTKFCNRINFSYNPLYQNTVSVNSPHDDNNYFLER